MAALAPCGRYAPHLWKKDTCTCLAPKMAHSESARQPCSEMEPPPTVWYVRPSEIMRQQGRVRGPSLSMPPAHADAAAAGASPARPAAPYSRALLRRTAVSRSIGAAAALSPERADIGDSLGPGTVSAVRSWIEGRSLSGPASGRAALYKVRSSISQTNSDDGSSGMLSPSHRRNPTARSTSSIEADSSAPGGQDCAPYAPNFSRTVSEESANAESDEMSPSDNNTLKVPGTRNSPAPLNMQLLEMEQYDGSMSSKIVDRARSPVPVLHHEGGLRGANTPAWPMASPLAPSPMAAEYKSPDSISEAAAAAAAQKDDEDDEAAEDEEDEHDEDDDENPSTESGMSPQHIQELLSRLKGSPAATAAAAVTAAQQHSSLTGQAPRSILVTRRRSSASRQAASKRKRRLLVSFNSCVQVREYGRVQGGSTSVTRSGAFSLGLDWTIQRECVAPLELSIDTIAERRRKAGERSEQRAEAGLGGSGAANDFAAEIADDEQLLTEADQVLDAEGNPVMMLPTPVYDAAPAPCASPDMFAEALTPSSLSFTVTSTPSNGGALQISSMVDDITIDAYRNQELKLHKRYPSNNKSEEMTRISEEGRLQLFERYVSGNSVPPSPNAEAGEAAAGDESDPLPSSPPDLSPTASSYSSSSSDPLPPALVGVLADPREWDEGQELESIRESRSGNFCSCKPPRGRSRKMLMDLPPDAIDALPFSEGNTCCQDESCACFRAGVGCHVESDHYCACAGSFVELLKPTKAPPRRRKRSENSDDDDEDEDEERDEEEEDEQDEDQDEEEQRDDDDESNDEVTPKPLPLAQAGCLNPSGRYQFDQRASGEYVAKFLYADPYAEEDEADEEAQESVSSPETAAGRSSTGRGRAASLSALSSPPIRFARARTPSALPSFFFRPGGAHSALPSPTSAAGADAAGAPAASPTANKRAQFQPSLSTLTES